MKVLAGMISKQEMGESCGIPTMYESLQTTISNSLGTIICNHQLVTPLVIICCGEGFLNEKRGRLLNATRNARTIRVKVEGESYEKVGFRTEKRK
jgi:hypothetical protein